MNFPISQIHASPVYLITLGFVIGIMGGFFGVGGSFIAGPALRLIHMPWNFAVGTDLAHILGKSIVAARKHRTLGHIDFRLGGIMAIGTIAGAETGAQAIEALKRHGEVNVVVSIVSIVVYLSISIFMGWETLRTRRQQQGRGTSRRLTGDENSVPGASRFVQSFRVAPVISLPAAGIHKISVWAILLIAFVGGIFSGFLGGGAGYIRMPAMIYLLGIPTHLAVGTDLFEIVISASYSTVSHALKGNVDILVALVMHTGAAVGAQVGSILTQFIQGPKIRLAFVPLPLIGAGIVIYTLITGQPHGH